MQTPSDDRNDLRSELRNDAENLTSAATDRLHEEVDARKSPLVDQAKSVSAALDRAAGELGEGAMPSWIRSTLEQGAQQMRRLAETIEQKDSRELAGSIRHLARDNPVTFLTACAAAGFAASRIFRAEADGSASGAAMAPPAPQPQPYTTVTTPVPPSGTGGVI
ncbi:hypothetical protein H5V43_17690 [Sphingobium fuliginis]|jgi:DNA primase|uniref:DUF3618 domain-containing protein n=1 Tax=Sphingobium fuliginis (strain ATCC 27551) TaxID=336203 RepID=A0A7M2GMK9_SPHSA|nr:hypothetical protein [Sphingobium fuliginis]QOT73981.1 hypothetical protein H5V43_17690 [Sphingobium fuliginis]